MYRISDNVNQFVKNMSRDRMKFMNTDKPLVTILTLNFNNLYLYQAIDSVLEQTYPRIEYIVIDDCSDKYQYKVSEIESYISKKNKGNIEIVSVIQNDSNIGIVKSSNKAYLNSCGKYIINLAGDDMFYDKYSVQKIVTSFERSNADIVCGVARKCLYDGTVLMDYVPNEYERSILKRTNLEILEYMSTANIMIGCCTSKSRLALEKYGMLDEHYTYLDDYPWYVNALRKGASLDVLDETTILYRMEGISTRGRVDWNYEKDQFRITFCELLPYSRHKLAVICEYVKWKISREIIEYRNHRRGQ